MLKKLTVYLSSFLLILSCQPFNISQVKTTVFNGSGKSNSFGIKSTTNPNEIKKNFLPITRISKIEEKITMIKKRNLYLKQQKMI